MNNETEEFKRLISFGMLVSLSIHAIVFGFVMRWTWQAALICGGAVFCILLAWRLRWHAQTLPKAALRANVFTRLRARVRRTSIRTTELA